MASLIFLIDILFVSCWLRVECLNLLRGFSFKLFSSELVSKHSFGQISCSDVLAPHRSVFFSISEGIGRKNQTDQRERKSKQTGKRKRTKNNCLNLQKCPIGKAYVSCDARFPPEINSCFQKRSPNGFGRRFFFCCASRMFRWPLISQRGDRDRWKCRVEPIAATIQL
jgi:hypothetical protein